VIHPYSIPNLNRFRRGELRVQLSAPGRERPIGYCDGAPEDEAELESMAKEEGVYDLPVQKKELKGGQQIWYVGAPPEPSQWDGDD
jgi:hypothetical protein